MKKPTILLSTLVLLASACAGKTPDPKSASPQLAHEQPADASLSCADLPKVETKNRKQQECERNYCDGWTPMPWCDAVGMRKMIRVKPLLPDFSGEHTAQVVQTPSDEYVSCADLTTGEPETAKDKCERLFCDGRDVNPGCTAIGMRKLIREWPPKAMLPFVQATQGGQPALIFEGR